MRFLIVDDSETMRGMLRVFSQRLGGRVAEAADGGAALTLLAASEPYDAILVDWDMPGVDGIGVLKAIRTSRAHARAKVMMVTAHTTMEHVAAALAAGADDYLMKPVDEDTFVVKLRLLGLVA